MEIPLWSKKTIYLLFALSGFCALVYEILWTKYLSLTFGTTMIAVSIVAGTFMAGLALGSYLLGRHADHETNLLRLYALLEGGIALFALLFPPTLKIVVAFHTWLVQVTPDHPAWTHCIQFFFSAVLLVPPTACMGGTFPLMCRLFARGKCGAQIGRLYALNTLGATTGSFAAGYLLLPAIGLSATGHIAIGLNLAIAAIAWRISRAAGPPPAMDVSRATRPRQHLLAGEHRRWLFAIAFVGFLSLAYEILWTRVFLLFLGNTTYAFSLILGTFLISLALGGVLYARLSRFNIDEKRCFIILLSLMGLAMLAALPFYDQLAHVFQFAHEASGESWWHLTLLSFLAVFAIVSLPTILSGALLPSAVAILDPGENLTGEGVGLVVLYNTVGAVLGSLIAGFLLVPVCGLQGSFRFLGYCNVLLVCLLLLPHGGRRSLRSLTEAAGMALLGSALILIPSAWDQQLMNSGVYIYAPKYARQGGIEKVLAQERVVEVIEGVDTTAAVHESLDGAIRFFSVNGKTDGGTGRDMATQLLVGHIPMLLHPTPREALVIGLGTGVTLKGLSAHPVERIDCVEISPEVVQASDYFRDANGNALDDPKINLTVEDGRNLLLTTARHYDVIISEPSNPWQSGNANLFTDEFYRLAAARLNPGGVFGQWIGLYDITPTNLRVACNTFLQTFPHALVFRAGSDIILVGSSQKLQFDYLSLKERLARPVIGSTLAAIGIESPGDLIAGYYFFCQDRLMRLAAGAAVNTDDHPILEFSSRYNLGENILGAYQMENIDALLDTPGITTIPLTNLGDRRQQIAHALRELGSDFARAGRASEARRFVDKAREVNPAGAKSS